MAEGDIAGATRVLHVTRAQLGGITPNEMRQIRDLSGVPLSRLMDDDDIDTGPEKIQMTAWLYMRRQGTPVTWDEAGDFLVIEDAEPAANGTDPTNASTGTPSPGSAGTGE